MRSLLLHRLSGVAFILACTLLPQAAAAANITISITDNAFSGKTIDLTPGDVVTWVNNGSMAHTVTADNNSFDSGSIAPGGHYTQTFTQAGNYPYYCKFHGGAGGLGMSGLIRVAGDPGPTVQPVVTSVPQSTESIARIQALLAQVVQLQQILANLKNNTTSGGIVVPSNTSTTVSSANCPRIGRVLSPGSSGDDVARLQQFLAADPSVYPEAQVSGYFGALTQAAVQRWQIKYNIVSTGTPDTTGFGIVGPRTAAAISLQCSTISSSTSTGSSVVQTSSGPTVGGFLQVTPTTGDAPLAVSVVATVNTVNSCSGSLYVLDWGDGTTPQYIPTSQNECSQLQQTYLHTYTYGGQYLVKLASGGHESTATLLVNGPVKPDPSQPTTVSTAPTLTISTPVGGENVATGGTLSIGWQTGGSIPTGSSIVFDLYSGAGGKVAPNDVIAISSYPAGTVPWIIPTGGAQVCAAIYPSGLCGVNIPTGSYKIHATVYAPSTGGNTFGPSVVSADSGIFTIIASAAPATTTTTTGLPPETFTASATSGAAPLSVNFSGTLTSADRAWCASGCFDLIRYGDGSADFVALPTAANSAQAYSIPHTYTSAGTYTATLYQGQTITNPTVGTPITITAN